MYSCVLNIIHLLQGFPGHKGEKVSYLSEPTFIHPSVHAFIFYPSCSLLFSILLLF